jgi:hypothetical protein
MWSHSLRRSPSSSSGPASKAGARRWARWPGRQPDAGGGAHRWVSAPLPWGGLKGAGARGGTCSASLRPPPPAAAAAAAAGEQVALTGGDRLGELEVAALQRQRHRRLVHAQLAQQGHAGARAAAPLAQAQRVPAAGAGAGWGGGGGGPWRGSSRGSWPLQGAGPPQLPWRCRSMRAGRLQGAVAAAARGPAPGPRATHLASYSVLPSGVLAAASSSSSSRSSSWPTSRASARLCSAAASQPRCCARRRVGKEGGGAVGEGPGCARCQAQLAAAQLGQRLPWPRRCRRPLS